MAGGTNDKIHLADPNGLTTQICMAPSGQDSSQVFYLPGTRPAGERILTLDENGQFRHYDIDPANIGAGEPGGGAPTDARYLLGQADPGLPNALTGAAARNALGNRYALHVQALTSSPADGATVYFGALPKAPVTAAATSKVYIGQAGVIRGAEIYCYSGTAGSNQAWSLYIRVNNTTDTLIATVSAATNERIFSNAALTIAVNAGDYIEIKGVQPTWTTNPLTTIYGGHIFIE